jgi:uncharacterized repeat protein (TIGR01451 family)
MINNNEEAVYEWDTIQVLAAIESDQITNYSSVGTEFSDYAPGSTAFIIAQNFSVGSTIRFQVNHVLGPGGDGVLGTSDDMVINLDGLGHEAWDVTDGGIGDLDGVANGSITTSWYVNPDDSLGATFLLSAQAIQFGTDMFLPESAYASFTDSAPVGDIDLRAAGSSVTINDAIFLDSANVGSGTGTYNTFLAIGDNDGNEEGFNSDDTPPLDSSNKDIDHAKTHSILLSEIPIKVVDGVEYYEFRVDLNENNSNPDGQISLDTFKIYTSSSSTIESLSTLTTQNLVYDMDAGGDRTLLLSEVSTGSGTDDYAVLVPVANFSNVDPASTFMYLDVQMGFKGDDFQVQGGFEEWSVQQSAGTLTGEKFNDMNADGTRDLNGVDNILANADDEVGVAGVTIFIDSNMDGILDLGERFTLTDAAGHYTFYGVPIGTYQIDEVIPPDASQTTGEFETATINSVGEIVTVDSIGNFYPNPALNIVKEAVPDQVANMAGEVLTYNISVENTGNVTLTNIVVTDPNADAAPLYVSGDLDTDGKLDVGETWLYIASHTLTQDEIDSNGGGDGDIDNIATADSNETGPDEDPAEIPVLYNPALNIIKEADPNQVADVAGELLTYNIAVQNTGNVTLTNILLTDPNADTAPAYVSGDLDTDGKLDVGETWLYTASHTLTQAEIDSNGGGDGKIDNIATADSNETGPDEDPADIAILYDPDLQIFKTVASVDSSGDGVLNHVGEIINYSIMVENMGNVTLTGLIVTDTIAPNVTYFSGDANNDNNLNVGETWVYHASYAVTLNDFNTNGGGDGDIDNTATADSNETGPDSASASVLIDHLPGLEPRTPGFWVNWKTYWDGLVANDPKQVGPGDHDASPGFAEHDVLTLAYTGSDDKSAAPGIQVIDPISNTPQTGLLIGDWNTNGITDAGESTIFLSLQDASDILNASTKQLQDMQYVLGRDVVATWLNNLSGSSIETANPSFVDIKDVLNEAIDWLHATAGVSGNPKAASTTAASSAAWNIGIDGPDAGTVIGNNTTDISAGNTIHQILDTYNNTGQYIVNPIPITLYLAPDE